MNRIQETINATKTIRLFHSSSGECFWSFLKNNKYLQYMYAEIGKKYYFLKAEKWVFCNRDI
jgi:hypothetical protein